MALYDGVDGIARKVTKMHDGVDGVARKVIKAYDGVEGIAREYYSSGIKWTKYSCNTSTKYTQEGPYSSSGSKTFSIAYDYDFYYSSMSFDSSNGYTFSGRVDCSGIYAWTLSEFQSKLVGKYEGISKTGCHKITSITDVTYSGNTATVKWTEDYYTVSTTTTYSKGSTSYGTVTASDGELPEEGTVVKGSATSSYCILKVGSTYYYYEKA